MNIKVSVCMRIAQILRKTLDLNIIDEHTLN